jgi:hypothetical protein
VVEVLSDVVVEVAALAVAASSKSARILIITDNFFIMLPSGLTKFSVM